MTKRYHNKEFARLLPAEKRQYIDRLDKAKTHSGMMLAMGKKPLGFWFTVELYTNPSPAAEAHREAARAEGLSWPGEFVDATWDPAERAKVVAYLNAGERMFAWLGYSSCRLCDNEGNGSTDLTDGVYAWPQGYAHYVAEHDVKPPADFIAHVLGRKQEAA